MVGTVVATVIAAGCVPAPSGPPPAPDPVAPVIGHFNVFQPRTSAPSTIRFSWSATDANYDILTCRIDVDGDLLWDDVALCNELRAAVVNVTSPDTFTATLEVDDGVLPPVQDTVEVVVGAPLVDTFDIDVRIDPATDPVITAAFENAAARWESVIISGETPEPLTLIDGLLGWIPGFDGVVDDLMIDADVSPIDGVGNVLGRATALGARSTGTSFYGIMQFDEADLLNLAADGRLETTILHEMGHVLGIGGGWLLRGLVGDVLTGSPVYEGPIANTVWNNSFGVPGKIPLADAEQLGTYYAHWRESVFDNELMTGFLDPSPNPLSVLTIASLADLSYGVDFGAADPYSLP